MMVRPQTSHNTPRGCRRKIAGLPDCVVLCDDSQTGLVALQGTHYTQPSFGPTIEPLIALIGTACSSLCTNAAELSASGTHCSSSQAHTLTVGCVG
jgi:hypothetical protein